MRSFAIAALVGAAAAAPAIIAKPATFFAPSAPATCFVNSAGRTIVHYSSTLHPSFKCTHTSATTCVCSDKHPTHHKGGCRQFDHLGVTHEGGGGDCTDAGAYKGSCANGQLLGGSTTNVHEHRTQDHHCGTCDAGYKLVNKACVVCPSNTYKVGHNNGATCATQPNCGRNQKISADTKTARRTCSSCDAHQYQTSTSHQSTSCTTWQGGCLHGALIAAGSRRQHDHCGSCHLGYRMSGRSCITANAGQFTRWGHTACPSGATRLYSGIAKGKHYTHSGGGANTVCFADSWQGPSGNNGGNQNGNLFYSIEYQNTGNEDAHHDREAACAVCTYPAPTYISWGRNHCDHGHPRMYYGLVMANHYTQQKGTYVCVDTARQWHAKNNNGDQNGGLWYTTEAQTGSLPGNVYTHDREITCAVCALSNSDKDANKDTYTRWGHKSCPGSGNTIYTGYAAGDYYGHSGSGANTVCLHSNPTMWGTTANNNGALLYGTEYQNTGAIDAHHDRDAACAVCKSESATVTVWGKTHCGSNGIAGTQLYTGLVMANHYTQQKNEFVCVDWARQWHAHNNNGDQNGNLWYTTEVESGSSNTNSHPHDYEVACVQCRINDSYKNEYHDTFTHWGSNNCPSHTSKLYTGWVGGAHYTHGGSGHNSLCMVNDGNWHSGTHGGNQNGALIYGTEYQNTGAIDGHHDRDASCSVCATKGRGVHTQWGRTTCQGSGIKTEYSGIVMATHYTQQEAQSVCVSWDRSWHVSNHNGDHNGNLWYTTETEVHSGQGSHDHEVACVVCSTW